MIKRNKKVEVETLEEAPEETSGRQESYFFPKYQRTIKAGSIKEARLIIKEGKNK